MSRYSISFLIFLFSIPVTGQILNWDLNIPNNWQDIKDSKQRAIYQTNSFMELYHQHIASPKDMINGREYVPYFYRSETSPLLYSGEELTSTLLINDRRYENIRLLYDTYIDEMVYIDTTRMINFQYPRIILNKDIVDGVTFLVNGERMEFRHLRFKGNPGENLKDGYYEIVLDGTTKYIIKHRSVEYTRDAMNEYHYSPEKYFFIGGQYHKIKNMKDLILLFGERSFELKEFLQRSKIKVRKAGKEEMAEVFKHYDAMDKTDDVLK